MTTQRLCQALRALALPPLLVTMACPTELPGDLDAGTPVQPATDAGQPPTDAGTPADAGSPVVGDESITLQGRVRAFEYVDPRPEPGATATALNADCNGDGFVDLDDRPACTGTAGADGSYQVRNLAPGSLLVVSVARPDETCQYEPGAAAPCAAGNFSTISMVNTGTDPAATTDLAAVSYQWLLDQAVACGAAPTLEAAGQDLTMYGTVLGTIRSENGEPAAGVSAASLSVNVGGYANTNLPTCFLDVDTKGTADTTDDSYVVARVNGVPVTQSTATGKFIIFKTRNSMGLGQGQHAVSVQGIGSVRVSLNAGKLGVVTVVEGQGAPEQIERVDFVEEIMPIFARNGCTACHRAGGSGSVPVSGLNDYYLDFTAEPSEVYRALRGPSREAGRLDYDFPEASALIVNPLYEDPPDHPNASFESLDEPDVVLLLRWIGSGANEYVAPVVQEEHASLTKIMEDARGIGCVSCHNADRGGGGPAGSLPLDGCIPSFAYPAGYGPTNPALPAAQQPAAENQRCVYWHLVEERVYTDPYYASQPDNNGNTVSGEPEDARRVNITEPDKSLLLRNPLCGDDADGNGVGDGCEDAPAYAEIHTRPRVFFDTMDPAYLVFRSWIAAAAPNDGPNGAAP